MIRVVLDANVYAVLNPSSNPGHIIERVRRNAVQFLLSPDILAEVKAVLLYPRLRKLHHRSLRWINAYVQELSDLAEITAGDVVVDTIKGDVMHHPNRPDNSTKPHDRPPDQAADLKVDEKP